MINHNTFLKNYNKIFIIAEIGVNHNGDLNLAKKMIDAAKLADADAVKFQTFKTKNLVTLDADKAEYQKKFMNEDSQYKMLKKLELNFDQFKELSDYSKKKDIVFLSSPFDKDSVDILTELNVPLFKLGSGELTNYPLINYILKKNKPLIISTGMASEEEIKDAVKFIGDHELIIMHCVTSYPAKFEDVNLKYITKLQTLFNHEIGFSDHTPSIEMPIAAATLDVKIIEKHFTINKNLPGPDQKASLNSQEFKNMVSSIRIVEKGLGTGVKKITPEEESIKKIVRKSIISNQEIIKGTIIIEEMLTFKRPGTGISPKHLNKILGKKSTINIPKNSIISWDMIK